MSFAKSTRIVATRSLTIPQTMHNSSPEVKSRNHRTNYMKSSFPSSPSSPRSPRSTSNVQSIPSKSQPKLSYLARFEARHDTKLQERIGVKQQQQGQLVRQKSLVQNSSPSKILKSSDGSQDCTSIQKQTPRLPSSRSCIPKSSSIETGSKVMGKTSRSSAPPLSRVINNNNRVVGSGKLVKRPEVKCVYTVPPKVNCEMTQHLGEPKIALRVTENFMEVTPGPSSPIITPKRPETPAEKWSKIVERKTGSKIQVTKKCLTSRSGPPNKKGSVENTVKRVPHPKIEGLKRESSNVNQSEQLEPLRKKCFNPKDRKISYTRIRAEEIHQDNSKEKIIKTVGGQIVRIFSRPTDSLTVDSDLNLILNEDDLIKSKVEQDFQMLDVQTNTGSNVEVAEKQEVNVQTEGSNSREEYLTEEKGNQVEEEEVRVHKVDKELNTTEINFNSPFSLLHTSVQGQYRQDCTENPSLKRLSVDLTPSVVKKRKKFVRKSKPQDAEGECPETFTRREWVTPFSRIRTPRRRSEGSSKKLKVKNEQFPLEAGDHHHEQQQQEQQSQVKEYLTFSKVPLMYNAGHRLEGILRIANVSAHALCFRVTSCSPAEDRYEIEPKEGKLNPNEFSLVRFTTSMKLKESQVKMDVFKIETIITQVGKPSLTLCRRLWMNTPQSKIGETHTRSILLYNPDDPFFQACLGLRKDGTESESQILISDNISGEESQVRVDVQEVLKEIQLAQKKLSSMRLANYIHNIWFCALLAVGIWVFLWMTEYLNKIGKF